MQEDIVTRRFRVSGMTCQSCENRIAKRLQTEAGVRSARVDCRTGSLEISFAPGTVSPDRFGRLLGDMGYSFGEAEPHTARKAAFQAVGLLGAIVVLHALGNRYGLLDIFNIFPEAEAGMGYGMIFVVGLLTSAHCLAMCGGINLSQTALQQTRPASKAALFAPTLLYGAGRVVSYTVIGAIVGSVGSLVGFSGSAKGVVQIIAGVFMMLMGLTLSGSFPWLRRFIPRIPGLTRRDGAGGRGPFLVGLLNGLMPCGPLQTMQIYALSTGDPVRGGVAMMLFALGTLPLTMGLGVAGSFLGQRFMGRAIRVGAVLVFVMGFAMLGNGLRLSGFAAPDFSDVGDVARAMVRDGVQTVDTVLDSGSYQAIRVRPGIPLKWTIRAEDAMLNGCNNRIFIPEYNIEKRLSVGDNVIEFTPRAAGIVPYMCWMGMISSRIIIGDVEDTGVTPEFDADSLPVTQEEIDAMGAVPW